MYKTINLVDANWCKVFGGKMHLLKQLFYCLVPTVIDEVILLVENELFDIQLAQCKPVGICIH